MINYEDQISEIKTKYNILKEKYEDVIKNIKLDCKKQLEENNIEYGI